ncbi:MAG: hypothetical protein ACM30E_10710 [Nitrososphaerales archaeon]
MDSGSLLWGVLALASGIFICAYGNVMFRFVLAVLGFMLGFSAVMWLGGGLQGGLLLVVAIVVGAIVAALLYSLVRLALYIAGGTLGIVIVLAILGLVGLAGSNLGIVGWILVIAGAGVGGFLGRGLGTIAIVLATAMAGAYLVVLGLAKLFGAGIESGNALTMLGKSLPFVVFVTVALISGLSQYEALRLRRRFLR